MALSHEIQKRIILIILVALTTILGYWFFFVHHYESTDNAYVKGNVSIVSPRVGGYIVSVNVEDNQQVEAGHVIAKIDDRDYQAKLKQGEAQIETLQARLKSLQSLLSAQEAQIRETQAGVKSAQANFDRAEKEMIRTKTLIKDGAVSRQIFDTTLADNKSAAATLERAKAAYDASNAQLASLKAQIEEAKAQLKNAQATLEIIKIDLENTEIKAVKAGTIGNRTVQVGQLVRPGTALAYFVPLNEVWIEANYKENQIERMRPNQPVTIKIDSFPGQKFYGRVDSLAPASGSEFSILPPENATGNFTKIVRRIPVKIVFDKEYDLSLIKPGMSSYVSVNTR